MVGGPVKTSENPPNVAVAKHTSLISYLSVIRPSSDALPMSGDLSLRYRFSRHPRSRSVVVTAYKKAILQGRNSTIIQRYYHILPSLQITSSVTHYSSSRFRLAMLGRQYESLLLRLTPLISNELVSYSILVSDVRSQLLNIPYLKGLGPLLKKTVLTNVAIRTRMSGELNAVAKPETKLLYLISLRCNVPKTCHSQSEFSPSPPKKAEAG